MTKVRGLYFDIKAQIQVCVNLGWCGNPFFLIFFQRHQLDSKLSRRRNNLHGGDGDHLAW